MPFRQTQYCLTLADTSIPQTSKLKRLPVLGGRFVYIDLLRLPTARRCAPPDTARPLEPRTPSAYSARSEGVQDAPPIGCAQALRA